MHTVNEEIVKQAKHSRWSDAEVSMLHKRVQGSKKTIDGLKEHAEQHGRSLGTVQQKYYSMRRGKATKKNANKIKSQVKVRNIKNPAIDVSSLSIEGIIDLTEKLRAEIKLRSDSLNAQVARLEKLKP